MELMDILVSKHILLRRSGSHSGSRLRHTYILIGVLSKDPETVEVYP